MKKSYILVLLLAFTICKVFAQPTTAPTTPPARSAANVISIYGAAYTNHTGTDFNPNWGQTGYGAATEITVGAEKIRSYPNFNYQGIDFGGGINFSSLDTLHLDVWTPNCTKLNVYLIDAPADHENFVTVNLTLSGWNSIAIPLSQYSSQGCTLNNIIQFKFVSNAPASSTIYLDNIYFYTVKSVPTLSNYTMPSGVTTTSTPITITAPTSNSPGAITYTSGNTSIATVSGNTITIVGGGTTTITANQAASGSYSAGSISAPLIVNYTLPSSAPAPTAAAANVISLLGTKYTNIPLYNNTWLASWSQAAVDTPSIAGNVTIRYSNLNYVGVEFYNNAVYANTSNLGYFNFDIWTPTKSTGLQVQLVSFTNPTPATAPTGSTVSIVNLPSPLPQYSWQHFSIPLSTFATNGLDLTHGIAQMLFSGGGGSATLYVENVYFSTSATVLPVNLAEFKASKAGTAAQLSWKTLLEVNNKGFGVERSADAINWNQIQFVSASASGSTGASYSATDNSPLNGVNYYRLKQLDNDGKIAYSSTASVNFAGTDAVAFSFYPNPAITIINVTLQTVQSSNATLNLVNVDGKTVKTIALTNQSSNSNVQINVADIAKGNYFLVLKDGTTIKTSKVLVN